MTRMLYDEFPKTVLLTFPEQGLGLGGVIHRVWIEEAARRNAPGGVHYCTEWTYRNSNIRYVFGHAWASHFIDHEHVADLIRVARVLLRTLSSSLAPPPPGRPALRSAAERLDI